MRICCGSPQRMWAMTTVWAPTRRRPAIISIFLGEQLEDVIDQLCEHRARRPTRMHGEQAEDRRQDSLPDFDEGCHRPETGHLPLRLPAISSSSVWWALRDSIASPNVVLNTIVAGRVLRCLRM